MNFNITAECVGVYIALLLGFFVAMNAVKRCRRTNIFICSAFSTAACALIDIASVYCINNFKTVPPLINHTVNVLYFISLTVVCVLVSFYYLEIIGGDETHRKKHRLIVIIPAAIAAAVYLSTPLTGVIYYFDKDGYHRGTLSFLTYAIMMYMLAVVLVTAYKHRLVITKQVKIVVIAFPILMVLATCIQFVDKDLLVTGLAVTGPLILSCLFFETDAMDIDSETGFGKHTSFIEYTKDLFESEQPFTCALISLDNTKELYDTLGRDRVREMRLHINSRIEHGLPEKTACFRLSENELAFVDTKSDFDDIMKFVGKVSDKSLFDPAVSLINISVGVISCPNAAQNPEELDELLEFSVNQAQMDENNSVFICNDDTRQKLNRRKDIINILKAELSSDENNFEVYYQPIYEISSGKFRTAEALVRLNKTPCGPIYPDEFIPIAEEMGMIDRLGAIVLEKTCRFMGELVQDGVDFDAISVNFSVQQIMRPNIIEEITDVVKSSGIPAEKLRIEITERVMIENFGHIKKIMNKLGKQGIKFYMDDFGTGYSNLSNMLELPFEYLKIDKSLVRAAEKSDKTYSVLHSISKAFIGQDIKILTEGVETENQQNIVESIGTAYIQGYLFAKPVPGNVAKEYFLGKRNDKIDKKNT